MSRKTQVQEAYREFLKSDFWKKLSDQTKARDGKCVRCDSAVNLQAHHVRYPNEWFDTKLEDLETLCRACHRAEHGYCAPSEFDRKWREIERCFNYQQRPAVSDWKALKAMIVSDAEVLEFGRLMFQYVYYQFASEQERGVQDWWMHEAKSRKWRMRALNVRDSIWSRMSPENMEHFQKKGWVP